MAWTDCLHEPARVLGLYGSAPSLQAFRLEVLSLGAGSAGGHTVRIQGDFSALPDPLPSRWAQKGYTRAVLHLGLGEVTIAEIQGVPEIRPNGHAGFEGAPVDLFIRADPEGPFGPETVVVSGESLFLTFRFACRHGLLSASVRGDLPSVY